VRSKRRTRRGSWTQRPLPVRRRQALQAVPWRGGDRRRIVPRIGFCATSFGGRLVAQAMQAHQRGDIASARRLSRSAHDRTGPSGRPALPGRDPLPAQPPR
jgi:hypothetical protein